MNRTALLAAAPLALALAAANASAVQVNIELSLLVDISGSIDTTEFNLQRQGYANAFSNPTFFSSVIGAGHSIAVNYIEWSGAGQQQQLVGWTQISSQADANAFAAAVLAAGRPFSGQTSPGEALNFASPLIFSNSFTSDKQIIDVSGDGSENVHNDAFVDAARNAAIAAGVDQINGLAIISDEANLAAYYAAHIQAGTGSFTNSVANFADFGAAIQHKLQLEISTGIPLPTTAGLGLAGLGLLGIRRRRTAR
jgi:hypothetical protein